MSKYTKSEIQQVIDDLDYAKAYFPAATDYTHDLEPQYVATMQQIRTSLSNASDILCDLSDDVIESLDKHREVFVRGAQ